MKIDKRISVSGKYQSVPRNEGIIGMGEPIS
jgi:hypothetical protein